MFDQILYTLAVATTLAASEQGATPVFRGDNILTIRHAKDGALDDPLPSIVADTSRQVRICILGQLAGATIEVTQSDTGTVMPILRAAKLASAGVKPKEYDCLNATTVVDHLLKDNENAFLRYEIKRTLGPLSPTAADLSASGCEQSKTLETVPEERKLSCSKVWERGDGGADATTSSVGVVLLTGLG